MDDELTAMAAGEPGPRDVLREMQAALGELNAARRARWQRHAAARQQALQAWQAANEAAGITGCCTMPWLADEPPPLRIF